MSTKQKILVGLSGGVDSAVTALLLKEQGHEIAGCYMQNWMAEKDDPYCSAEQDLTDAKKVCDQLQIPFHLVNFSREYWDNVFQYCLDEFVAGRTPNPDIWCNQYIKFDVFLKHAINLGFDFLATGHYAQNLCRDAINRVSDTPQYQLAKALDNNKDQTYFLYTLTQEKLSRALFPLGELNKPEVRNIAKKAGLLNAEKKDSTGICFIGERKFKNFLQDFILAKPGLIKTVDGKTIGKHDGLMFYTLGQRKGLNIGGLRDNSLQSALEAERSKCVHEPWFVISKNIDKNELIVGQGHNNPLLFSSELKCEKLNWISGESPKHLICRAKTRYRQADQACSVTQIGNDKYHVTFNEPQRAITSGQSVVFYDDKICLGGGIIT